MSKNLPPAHGRHGLERQLDEDDYFAVHLEFDGMTFREMWSGD